AGGRCRKCLRGGGRVMTRRKTAKRTEATEPKKCLRLSAAGRGGSILGLFIGWVGWGRLPQAGPALNRVDTSEGPFLQDKSPGRPGRSVVRARSCKCRNGDAIRLQARTAALTSHEPRSRRISRMPLETDPQSKLYHP